VKRHIFGGICQVLFRKKWGILIMNKEKALKNQGLEFREDISVKGGTQPQTILFGSVSGLKKN